MESGAQNITEREDVLASIAKAHASIVEVLMEVDHIELQVNPQILADYAVKIGVWENRLLEAQIAARRAKRKLSLAQACLNQGLSIDTSAIEQQLDQEFAAWQDQLNHQLEAYSNVMEARASMRTLTSRETCQLKKLHRTLVRRLHPDLHPELGEEGQHLFMLVQRAYELGDLVMLTSLEVATQKYEASEEPTGSSLEELYAELAIAEVQLEKAEKRLETLKSTMPYALLEKLNDAQWVCARVDDLKAQVEQQDEARRQFEQRLKELERGAES